MSLRNHDQGQGDKHRDGGQTLGSWALFTVDSNDLASWKSVGKLNLGFCLEGKKFKGL